MTTPGDLPALNQSLELEAQGPDVTDVVDTLVGRLRSVRETYERQVQAETALASEREQIETARRELAERNAELAALKEEIASRGAEAERTGAEADRRRAALAKLEQDIQHRTADVSSREREALQKQNALREERKHLEDLKSEIEEDRRNLVRRASELERREAELTRRAAEAISGEDQAHTRQLLEQYEAERRNLEPKIREIEESAQRTQKELESKLAEILAKSEQREKELADKLKEQESLAGSLRTQLEISANRHRRELAEREAAVPPMEKRPNFLERTNGPMARRVSLWISWCAALGFLALGAQRLFADGDTGAMAALFGLAFGALYFGAHSIGRKLFFPPAIVVGVVGTAAGLWLPAWVNACEVAAATWDIPLDSLSPEVAANVPTAFAVLSACFVLGLGMMICTSSWAVAAYVTAASVIAAGLIMFPDPTGSLRYVAALLWLMLIGTALSQWGSSLGDQQSPGRARFA